MWNLNTILLGAGVIVIIASLVITLILSNIKKNIFVGLLVMIIGILFLSSGLWLTIKQGKTTTADITAINNTPTITSDISTIDNTPTNTADTLVINNTPINTSYVSDTTTEKFTVSSPFDPTGSVLPKVLKDGGIVDADGSKVIDKYIFTSEGYRYWIGIGSYGATIAVPDNATYSDGKHYKEYNYSVDGTDGDIYITTEYFAVADENSPSASKDLGGSKFEIFPANKGYEMKKIDFIRKYLPVPVPKNTTKNNFLCGEYYGRITNTLKTETIMIINFDKDTVNIDCGSVGINDTYFYKLEALGKNAYKLYLYTFTVKADSEGGVMVNSDAIFNTFIIYRTGTDSFDIAYIGNNVNNTLQRISLNMTR